MTRRTTVQLFCAFLLFVAVSSASGNDLTIAAVRGEITAEGGLALYVETGPPITNGLRLYSEPSHTLLLVLLDSGYASGPLGKEWLGGLDKERAASEPAVLMTSLPGARPRVDLRGRPSTDRRIAVWANGVWPDGSTQDLLVADAEVGVGGFSFRTELGAELEPGSKVGGGYRHCCEGTGCSMMCVTCSGPQFTCCILDTCCDIFCGWAGSCCAG